MRQVIDVPKVGKASPAGIVDDDIKASELFDALIDQALAICNDTDVLGAGLAWGTTCVAPWGPNGLKDGGLDAMVLFGFLRNLDGFIFAGDIIDDHIGSFSGEFVDDDSAQPPAYMVRVLSWPVWRKQSTFRRQSPEHYDLLKNKAWLGVVAVCSVQRRMWKRKLKQSVASR